MSSDSEPDCYYDHNDKYENYCKYEKIERNLRNNNKELLNKTLNEDSDIVKSIRSRINATRFKSAEMFKFLLSNGADISITEKSGLNFLQAALIRSPIETVELVVQKLHVDYENQGDFEVAGDIQKCKKIVKFLLNKKINLLFPNSKFSLLLFFVLKFGDEETFKLVLQTDNEYFHIDALGPNQNPMLHNAICLKKTSHVNLLLAHGASIHVIGYDKQTFLHRAVAANNLQLVHYLLQRNVNVNAATNDNNFTPLHYAVAIGNKEIVESLLNAGADIQAEFINEKWRKWTKSSMLNIVCGCTKLNTLSSKITYRKCNYLKVIFDIEMMQYLLKRGAQTEVLDYRIANGGLTPLERACQAGRMDVLQLLAKYGANFHRVNDRGSTMIHHAVIGGNIRIIDLLLRMNFDINAKNKRGQSPLYHATNKNVKMDAVSLIEFLVDNGANVDVHLLRGYHLKLPDVVQCLLELIENFKVKNSQGNWPLQTVLNYTVEITLSTELLIAFMAATEIDINFDYFQPSRRELMDTFYQECKNEVSRMKSVKFREDKLISLFDFLTNDLMKVTNFTVIEKILKNLESSELVCEYPHYAFLLEKRIGRVKTILYFKDAIADFLEKYTMLKLPIDVVDYIFSYLRVGQIRNFARALSLTKKESKTGTLPLPGCLSAQCKKR